MAVLLTAAHSVGCLAVARALHARGLAVIATGRPRSLTLYSRSVSRALTAPSSLREPGTYGRFILDAVRAHGVDLVLPLDDSSLLALDDVREDLERSTRLGAAPSPCLRTVLDKERLARYAATVGMPMPRAFRVSSANEARAAASELGYPIVLKPLGPARIGQAPPGHGFKIRFAARWEDVEESLRPYAAAGRCLLLQEYYPGRTLCLDGVCADGEPLAMVARQSLKTHPLTGLVGLVRETVPLEPALRERASRLLLGLRYEGPFNLQFRQSPRDGGWRLTDFNPRFSVHVGTTIRAGVDLPHLVHEWFVGRRMRHVHDYAIGIRGRRLLGDLHHTALVLRGKDRGIDPYYPTRWEALKEFSLDFVRTHHHDECTLRDPLPALMEALSWGGVVATAAMHKLRVGLRPAAPTAPPPLAREVLLAHREHVAADARTVGRGD